ncbi:hypothetical protein TTHERM_00678030 (macronuclear) [Tetrahymena thermophila SB210]|uniref:Uncharacterized protein n=1 Tax=Tetrahymena thermophila (strain SB210) TaxID=312017 RepID=I7MJV5_TETTS|nr:hypothetical protein TTHERM_00678030 [Tetrahymena thermophila SB210]EAS07537.1 hypothetical protein TTHERM_00678030 [Tetrahymena thermophila SB210]|eukprot:XP_001027779.1 hypothetical protein TTHERM_00678030 [Tetrahymena thermophila SB210]
MYQTYHYAGRNYMQFSQNPVQNKKQDIQNGYSEQCLKQIEQCQCCSFYIFDIDEPGSLIDPQNQIFLIGQNKSVKQTNGESNLLYLKARFIRVIGVIEKDIYQILNLLVINEEGELQVLNLILYTQQVPDVSFDFISQNLQPDQVYAFEIQLIEMADIFEFKQYSQAKTIKGAPRLIHMHQNQTLKSDQIKSYPNLQLSNLHEIQYDLKRHIVHKVYNILGVLKYYSIQKLDNFQYPEQNCFAYLHLVDRNSQSFKAKVWGNSDEFSQLKAKQVILLMNYKIDYQNIQNQLSTQSQISASFAEQQAEIQLQSIGFSRYEINPVFISPSDLNQLEFVRDQIFFSTINELNYMKGFFDEIVLTEMLIEVAYLNEYPLRITFQDVNYQTISTVVENKDLEDSLRKENLDEYSSCYFNLYIRPKLSFEANGQQNVVLYLRDLN